MFQQPVIFYMNWLIYILPDQKDFEMGTIYSTNIYMSETTHVEKYYVIMDYLFVLHNCINSN